MAHREEGYFPPLSLSSSNKLYKTAHYHYLCCGEFYKRTTHNGHIQLLVNWRRWVNTTKECKHCHQPFLEFLLTHHPVSWVFYNPWIEGLILVIDLESEDLYKTLIHSINATFYPCFHFDRMWPSWVCHKRSLMICTLEKMTHCTHRQTFLWDKGLYFKEDLLGEMCHCICNSYHKYLFQGVCLEYPNPDWCRDCQERTMWEMRQKGWSCYLFNLNCHKGPVLMLVPEGPKPPNP